MSHKRHGQFTVSKEWAKHLRPFFRRAFWKQERQAANEFVRSEAAIVPILAREPAETFDVSAELEADLQASLAEAERGETISSQALFARLRRGD